MLKLIYIQNCTIGPNFTDTAYKVVSRSERQGQSRLRSKLKFACKILSIDQISMLQLLKQGSQ